MLAAQASRPRHRGTPPGDGGRGPHGSIARRPLPAQKHRPDGRRSVFRRGAPTAAGRPRGAWAGKRPVTAGRPHQPPAWPAKPRVAGGKTPVLCEPAKPEGGNPPTDPHLFRGKTPGVTVPSRDSAM